MGMVLENMLDGLIIVNVDGDVIYTNSVAAQMFCLSKSEANRFPLESIIPVDARKRHKDLMTLFASDQNVKKKEMSNWRMVKGLRRDGKQFPALVTISKLTYGDRKFYTATIRDMTDTVIQEHRNFEINDALQSLQQKTQEVSLRNEAKSKFLSAVSHELRTPLNAISNYALIVRDEIVEIGKAELLDDIEKIDGACRHMISLVNNLLDVAKVESGRMELHVTKINLGDFLHSIKAIVEPLKHTNENQFHIKGTWDLGTIWSDETKLRQVLINLIGNAFKFTKKGIVSLVSRRVRDGVEFSVSDNGRGMTQDEKQIIFEPFVQANETIAQTYGGTGLGLALVKSYVELLGGHTDVTSSLGEGSTFVVFIPLMAPKETLVNEISSITAIKSVEAARDSQHHRALKDQFLPPASSIIGPFIGMSSFSDVLSIWLKSRGTNYVPTADSPTLNQFGSLLSKIAIVERATPDQYIVQRSGSIAQGLAGIPIAAGFNLLDLSTDRRELRIERWENVVLKRTAMLWKTSIGSGDDAAICGIALPMDGPNPSMLLYVDVVSSDRSQIYGAISELAPIADEVIFASLG
jgi:PAS domain S-box-containing protein